MSNELSPSPLVLDTPSGRIRGLVTDGIAEFRGIRYATAERFAPPVHVPAWSGELDATRFGPTAQQNPSMMDMLFGEQPEPRAADCLFLNVWAPVPDGELRPVMVWIHGGGFEMGSGSSPLYHGDTFARSGVVLVTINYRLGAFGFLDLSGLSPDHPTSGNNGLLDQVAALRWVRDHIEAFGGDPQRVTIFGESAGAMSVSLLSSMPSAQGLFGAVIAQSGAASAARTADQAHADTAEFLHAAQLHTLDDVLGATDEQLLAAHTAMSTARIADLEGTIRRTGSPLSFLAFRPVADGVTLPVDPLDAIRDGSAAGVRMIVGTNSEEWKLFALMSPPPDNDDELVDRLRLIFEDPSDALETYRDEHPDAAPSQIEAAVLTDLVFREPASRLADAQAVHAPVYQYLFDWRSPAMGGMLGAAHAMEIPFVFDRVDDPRLAILVGTDAPRELASRIHAAWIAFASDGVPRADGLDPWPTVTADRRPVMVFGEPSQVVEDPLPKTLAFWTSHHIA